MFPPPFYHQCYQLKAEVVFDLTKLLNTKPWKAMADNSISRQHPGLACEECRRRKARCDRVRPRCGICAETGQDCVVVEKRPPRGPKKGQMQELRSRLGKLQASTSGAHGAQSLLSIPITNSHLCVEVEVGAPVQYS